MTRIGTYEALGACVTIDAADPLAAVLAECLTDLAVAGPPGHEVHVALEGDARFSVTVDGDRRADGLSAGEAVHYVLVVINEFAAQRAARDHVVLHAGVVAFDGRAVAIVGTSGAGKTTLTGACLLAGASLVAEEVCAVDEDGYVLAYHRPLGLRPGGAAALGLEPLATGPEGSMRPVRGGHLGTLSGPALITGVVLVLRRPGGPELRRLAGGEALARLSGQTLGDGGRERAMFRRLDGFVRDVPVWDVAYEVTQDAVAAVRRVAARADGSLRAG